MYAVLYDDICMTQESIYMYGIPAVEHISQINMIFILLFATAVAFSFGITFVT